MDYSRRSFSKLGLRSLAGCAAFAWGANRTGLWAAEQAATLGNLAAKKGLLFGSAVQPQRLADEPDYAALVASQCSILVPEGCLKWKALRPAPDSFDFRAADAYIAFGEKHRQKLRGHTLVWHEALPDWFKATVNPENAKERLQKHLQTVVGRYAGRIGTWDVVNEAILPDKSLPNHLRKTPWLELLGPDYLDIAYHAAAQADPSAKLFYNDYGLEDAGERSVAKREAVLELLRGLKKRNVPLHGFGFQSHLAGRENWEPTPGLEQFVRVVADLGLEIYLTELDVGDTRFPSDSAARDRAVAAVYKRYLDVMLGDVAVKAVLCWGITDKYTWLNKGKRADGLPQRPLPFDERMKPTAVFNAIAQAFDKAPSRSA